MKKIYVSLLGALGCAGLAQAQSSSLTLFGIVDMSLSRGQGSVSDFQGLRNSGTSTSQLGLRGLEDLGNGLKAGFWLEAELAPDTGSGLPSNSNNQASGASPAAGLTFNRRSTVSLSGPWGQLIAGRDYHPMFWNTILADPFGMLGAGTTQILASRIAGGAPSSAAVGPYGNGANALVSRASNSIAYAWGFAPNALTSRGSGTYVHAMYFMGENARGAAHANDGQGYGLRVGYAEGPVHVAAGVLKSRFAPTDPATLGAANFHTAVLGNIRSASLLASYDFGFARPRALLIRDEFGQRSGKGWMLGTSAPLGIGELRLAYSAYQVDQGTRPRSTKIALGYVHPLSPRTAIYGTYARLRNSGGADRAVNGAVTAPNAPSSGFDLGLRHTF